MNLVIEMNPLTIPERKRLKGILESHRLVRSNHFQDREAFLKDCGLLEIRNDLDCNADPFSFVTRLISELEDRRGPDGNPRLGAFLFRFLENYDEKLGPEDRTFIAEILNMPEPAKKEDERNGSMPPSPVANGRDSIGAESAEGDNLGFLRSFMREAVQAVPAVKWAVGVGGIAAVVALISMPVFGLPPKNAFIGLVVMFLFMAVLVIFAKVSKLNTELRTPARIFTWFSLILFMTSSVLLLTSAFFGWPREFALLFGTTPSP